jgi:DeoR/GlpR family transcriptional regulator of sugar metabolism
MMDSRPEEINATGRRKEILTMVNNAGSVKVAYLSKIFDISEVTIRNDLSELEKSGLLERVHGGAVSTYKTYYSMTFDDRMKTNIDEKKSIAAAATALISDGDTIMLSSGTTPLYVVKELKNKKDLTVVTNSLAVAQEACFNENIYIIMLGGNLNTRYMFNHGYDTLEQLEKYKASKFILSPDGVNAEDGVSTCYHLEAEINRQMIARSAKTIVVADYTKIGRTSFAHIESMCKIENLVTNKVADEEEIKAIENAGVEVILV